MRCRPCLVGLLVALVCFACRPARNGASSASGGARAGAGGVTSSAGGAAGSSSVAGAGGASLGGAAGGSATGGAGGADAGPPGQPVAFIDSPTFTGNDNPAAPQAGVLRLTTDVAAKVHVEVSGGDERWTLDLPGTTSVKKPIVGLKPATTYDVTVSVSAGANTLTAGPLSWTTPPLPTNFLPIQVTKSDPSKMEPGMTLFAIRDGWYLAQAPVIIVDHQGTVRWYFSDRSNMAQEDLRQLPNGNLFFGRDFCTLREIDLLGNVVRAFHASKWPGTCTTIAGSVPVEVDDFHHESAVLATGNVLTLSTETRQVAGYPTSETDANAAKQNALVMGSAIVEFTPTGEIVKRISMLDLLDPTRIGRDSLTQDWSSQHATPGQRPYDWDHANAVIYDASSDSYLVSLRHQDAVVKVNRTSGTLTWILGNPANWVAPWKDKLLAPTGNLLWPFHQHAVELNALGLGLYDNGNYRAAAYQSVDGSVPEYSRAAIYKVDETAKTVSQVWSYGPSSGSDSFYSTGMGDADWQPATGNVLLTSSQIVAGDGSTYAQIVEVTPDGTRVFELNTKGSAGSVYPVYRADRIQDLRGR